MFKLIFFLIASSNLLLIQALGQCCRCNNYGPELVNNGNFSSGNAGFTTSYSFSTSASPGRYGITTNANSANPLFWRNCFDHTSGTGNLIWYDLSSSTSINMWTQQITNILPNSNYLFSCWINTLDPSGPAVLRFSINGQLVGNMFTAPITLCNWVQKCFIWHSGSNTSASITITNQSTFASGNDVGIDDISFRQCIPLSFTYPEIAICQGQTYQLPNGASTNTAGTYIDTLTTSDGCDSLRIITIKNKPTKDTTLNINICSGESYLGYNIFGSYVDTLIGSNGCDSIRNLNLNIKEKIFLTQNLSICKGENYLGHTETGIYLDTLTTIYGCDSIIKSILAVQQDCNVYFPLAFTPNGDGRNDIFRALNSSNLGNFNLVIYSRWGEKVFEAKNHAIGWDGYYKGKPQNSGVYIWHCSFVLAGHKLKKKGYLLLLK